MIMYLKVLNISLCIYVVNAKLLSMDWSPLNRLDPTCDDSMLALVKFYISYCHAFIIDCLNIAFLEF